MVEKNDIYDVYDVCDICDLNMRKSDFRISIIGSRTSAYFYLTAFL